MHYDALFKSAFSQPHNAAALVRTHLSSSLDACFDWSTMRLVPGSFVDEALRERLTDLLFEVDTPFGPALIYILLEHQSSNHSRMVLRMSRYMDRIWEDYDREHPNGPLPLILPVLICHAPEGWTAPRSFHELFDPTAFERAPELARHVPSFELLVDDLRRTSDDELASRGLAAFAMVTLWLLRDGRAGKLFAQMSRWAGLLDELPRASLEAVLNFIASVSGNSPVIWEEFRANLHQLVPSAEGKTMNIIEQWISQGEARGRTEGRTEGRAEGRAETLTKLLALKFGELSEPVQSRLASASPSEIDVWLERVLFAATLDQVFVDRH